MRSWLKTTLLVMAGVCAMASPGRAQTPDGTMVYSRIANWQIARVHWEDYEADLKKRTLPVLDKLLADGVITEYGVVSAAVHTADGYTHTTWFSSKTIAGLEKALAAIVAADAQSPAAEKKRGDTDFSGTKHADVMVQSRVVGGRTTKLTSGYCQVSMDQIQPGKVQAYNERYKKLIRPVLQSAFASGVVTSFGIDNEYVHTGDPLMRSRWIIVPNAEGLDKVFEAGTAAGQARTPAERDALAQAAREILVGAAHRDELWQITAYASKY